MGSDTGGSLNPSFYDDLQKALSGNERMLILFHPEHWQI
jgi:hypothetical protein